MRSFLIFVVACAFSFAGCSRAKTEYSSSKSPPSAETYATSAPPIDACTLLTSSEVEFVQGEPVVGAKLSTPPKGVFASSQCYLLLRTPVNSVVLNVMQRGSGPAARDPKEFWSATFRRAPEGAEEGEGTSRREENEKKPTPLKVEGVGEEAFWSGNAVGGALFVLKGNIYLRVSVGGAGDGEAKIEKSRKLASFALKRL